MFDVQTRNAIAQQHDFRPALRLGFFICSLNLGKGCQRHDMRFGGTDFLQPNRDHICENFSLVPHGKKS